MSDSKEEFFQKAAIFSDEFIDGYEFIGDAGVYTPDNKERVLIRDCVEGLLCEMEENGFIGYHARNAGESIAICRCGDIYRNWKCENCEAEAMAASENDSIRQEPTQ